MKTSMLAIVMMTAAFGADLKIGKPLSKQPAVSIADLAAKPDAYVGKSFQVKGTITEVCQVMGCWVMLTDGKGSMMRVQMEEGKVAFPKDAAGRKAVAEGKLAKYDLSKEEAIAMAKHAAEDAGRAFNADAVKAPFVYYQIEGVGAVISE
jgi:hypothetical protein